MKSLPEVRVARLAECHSEQKAGYDQHTSPSPLNCSLLVFDHDLQSDQNEDAMVGIYDVASAAKTSVQKEIKQSAHANITSFLIIKILKKKRTLIFVHYE